MELSKVHTGISHSQITTLNFYIYSESKIINASDLKKIEQPLKLQELEDSPKELKKPTCANCKEPIKDAELCVAESLKFHTHHFFCTDCQKPLAGKKYGLDNQKPYCTKCFEIRSEKKCSRCGKLNETGEKWSFELNVFHLCENCYSEVKDKKCNDCGSEIEVYENRSSVNDDHWHPQCFMCKECQKSLIDCSYRLVNKALFCSEDCSLSYKCVGSNRCQDCGEVVDSEENIMIVENFYWHVRCFVCKFCRQSLLDNSLRVVNNCLFCSDFCSGSFLGGEESEELEEGSDNLENANDAVEKKICSGDFLSGEELEEKK